MSILKRYTEAIANKDDENKKIKKINENFFTYLDIGVAPVSKLTIFPSLYL